MAPPGIIWIFARTTLAGSYFSDYFYCPRAAAAIAFYEDESGDFWMAGAPKELDKTAVPFFEISIFKDEISSEGNLYLYTYGCVRFLY